MKDILIYQSPEFENREKAEIHFVFFIDALDYLLEDRNIDKRIDVAMYEIIEFDKSASDIPERYIEGLNSEELLTTLMTRYGITWKDFINSDKGSSWAGLIYLMAVMYQSNQTSKLR